MLVPKAMPSLRGGKASVRMALEIAYRGIVAGGIEDTPGGGWTRSPTDRAPRDPSAAELVALADQA